MTQDSGDARGGEERYSGLGGVALSNGKTDTSHIHSRQTAHFGQKSYPVHSGGIGSGQ
jgi:hypothetical protein